MTVWVEEVAEAMLWPDLWLELEKLEDAEDHFWAALEEVEAEGLLGLPERCGFGVGWPNTMIFGTGASSGDMVTVSSKMVVGVSGRPRTAIGSSAGANPDRFAW